MKTAKELHEISIARYPLRSALVNELLARCENTALSGKFKLLVPISWDDTKLLLNEREIEALEKLGYTIHNELYGRPFKRTAWEQFITW